MPSVALLFGSIRLLVLTKRTIALAGLQVAPAILYLFASNGRSDISSRTAFLDVGLIALFGLVVPICVIVLASSALGAERRDQTLSLVTLRPIPRASIAAVKFVAAWVSSFALAVFGVLVMHLALLVTVGADVTLMMAMIVGAGVSTLAYCAVYVPLGFITDRAVIIGLALLLVFENGVVAALPGLANLSPLRVGIRVIGSVAPDTQRGIEGVIGSVSFSSAATVIAVAIYVGIGLLVTATLLRRRDLA
jgi:ABC-type transport system involved in multi-copper enzyme maturation permease subunit